MHGTSAGDARPQAPDIDRVKPVDILLRVDRQDDPMHVDLRRQRQLHEDAVDPFVGVEPGYFGDQGGLAGVARQPPLERAETGGGAGGGFGADIGVAGRVIADQDRGEAGHKIMCCAQLDGGVADASTQFGSDCLAVDNARVSHAVLLPAAPRLRAKSIPSPIA